MFNDIVGKLIYGDANDEVEKIKRIEGNGGYKVYYEVENEKVVYNLDVAKNAMEKVIRTQFDRVVFNVLVDREWKMDAFLRKYDYNKVARTENAKCTVILLAVVKELIDCEAGRPVKEVGEIMDAFTCRRESEVAKGRYIDFTELNNYLKYLTETVNDDFYNASMDYIMNVILKYNL